VQHARRQPKWSPRPEREKNRGRSAREKDGGGTGGGDGEGRGSEWGGSKGGTLCRASPVQPQVSAHRHCTSGRAVSLTCQVAGPPSRVGLGNLSANGAPARLARCRTCLVRRRLGGAKELRFVLAEPGRQVAGGAHLSPPLHRSGAPKSATAHEEQTFPC
jgi:hypothetical protein